MSDFVYNFIKYVNDALEAQTMVKTSASNDNICILCIKTTSKTIKIFDKSGCALKIAEILCQHYWFTFNETDKSKRICLECWQKTDTFHQFYKLVREAHLQQNTVIQEVRDEVEYEDGPDPDWHSDDNHTDFVTNSDENKEDTKQTCNRLDEQQPPVTKVTDDAENDDDAEQMGGNKSDSLMSSDEDVEEIVIEKLLEHPGTMDRETLLKLEREVTEYFRMNCDLCGQQMSSLDNVKKHFSTKHKSNRGYLICCCNKKVKMRRSIIEHVQWHINPNRFQCDECSKKFNEMRALRKHMVIHRTKDEDRVDCHRCGKRFVNQRSLNEHTSRVHPPDHQKFTCDICQRHFKLKGSLESHIKCMHSRTTQRYICDICAKVQSSKQSLKEHTNTHFDNPRVECNICGALLKNRICLKTHMRSHNDTKQTCDICFQVKANRSALNSHKRRVHGQAKHKCNFCEKSFTRPSALREHIATHTGENLYTCKYCPQTFKSDSNMYKHMKQVHTEQWTNDRKRR